MSLLDGLRHRLRVLFRGEQYARDVERELRFHVELETLAQESGDAEAELETRRLGNVTYYREEVRRMTLQLWVDRVLQDVTYSLRGLRRSPGFALAVILTLALGIGVNGAMFSLLDRIFLQPPSGVMEPRDVRRVYEDYRSGTSAQRLVNQWMAYPQVRALRAALDSSIAIGAYIAPESTAVRVGDQRIPARRSLVTNEYFSMLGVRPAAGRFFGTDEAEVAVPAPVAVVSDAFWQRAFGGSRDIVGKEVRIGAKTFSIVGVAPPGFTGVDLDAVDVWMPINLYDRGGGNGSAWYNTFGAQLLVLFRSTSVAQEDRVLGLGTTAVRPVNMDGLEYDPTVQLRSGPILRALGPADRPAEVTVATRVGGVALIVLLIACANVTNLFLLRAAQRRREIAIRQALGVSRSRLMQQFIVESVMLALCSGAAAVAVSLWAGTAIRRLVLPRVQWASGSVDVRTTVFVGIVAVVVGVIAGLAPALQALGTVQTDALKAGTRGGGYRGSRFRAVLLAVQSALCLVLLVGAGLFIRSLESVRSIGVGYDPENQIFIRPAFDDPRAHDAELRTAIPEAARRLRAMDGVEAVAYTSVPPLQGASFETIHLADGREPPQLPGDYGPSTVAVSPDFFRTSGLSVRQGREFTDADNATSPRVMLINESLARLYWPGEQAIGKCIHFRKRENPCFSIVGVVADAHRRRIIEAPIGQVYVPIAQRTDTPRDLIIRAKPGKSAAAIRAAEQTLGPLVTNMVGLNARTFASVLEPQLRPWRLGATLFTALGTLALVVAAIGIYSVVAYGVSQRVHEMGIRIALGARPTDILDLVLGEGLKIVVVGIACGVVIALALGRLVASLLFGVVPSDPSILVASATLLCVIGAVACLVPGWRAVRVDPVTSLRAD